MKTDREILWITGMEAQKEFPGLLFNKGEWILLAKKYTGTTPNRFLTRWLEPYAKRIGNDLWKVKTKEEREAELGRLVR